MNSHERTVAGTMAGFLTDGTLKIASLMTTGKALKNGGFTKNAVVAGIGQFIEDGGDEALSVLAAVIANMGVEKVQAMNEHIKEVQATVVKTEPAEPQA